MELMEVEGTPWVPLRMSEKELTKGAKRILDDTEESGTSRLVILQAKHWHLILLIVFRYV